MCGYLVLSTMLLHSDFFSVFRCWFKYSNGYTCRYNIMDYKKKPYPFDDQYFSSVTYNDGDPSTLIHFHFQLNYQYVYQIHRTLFK